MSGLAVIVLVGVMMCASVLVMLYRLGIRKFLGYPNTFDVCFGILMVMEFHGTYTGMVAAGVASLTMSCILVLLRSTMGAERAKVSVKYKRVMPFSIRVKKPGARTDVLNPDYNYWVLRFNGIPIPYVNAVWVHYSPSEL